MHIESLNGKPLSLKNDGKLEIFFLGVGSAFALKHFQTNFLIIKGDAHILVDFGMTGPTALKATAGLTVPDIDCVLPTHSHADHVGGLECIGLMNRYVGMRFMNKGQVNLIVPKEYQHILWTHTLQGGLEWNEQDGVGHRLQLTDYFTVIHPVWLANQPREMFRINYRGINIDLFRTNHVPETKHTWDECFLSYGMIIDDMVFISGDTKFDMDLIEMAMTYPYIFHDVQFFPGSVHAPLSELRLVSDYIRKKIHLVHYSDDWEKQDITGFAGWTQQGVRYIFD